jgi:hypothetical protein
MPAEKRTPVSDIEEPNISAMIRSQHAIETPANYRGIFIPVVYHYSEFNLSATKIQIRFEEMDYPDTQRIRGG